MPEKPENNLVPPDCDLRDFRFMPVDVERLRRSKAWLIAKRNPELGFYMMNLWMVSWHELPAASLEDDDDVLADAAMCDIKRWAKVKDTVLRGWVKGDDGRLYHPVVAEKARDAWEGKWDRNDRSEQRSKHAQRAAHARWARRENTQSDARRLPEHMHEHEPEHMPDDAQHMPEHCSTDALRGKGQGEGEYTDAIASERANASDATPPPQPTPEPSPSTGVKNARKSRISADWQPDDTDFRYAEGRGHGPRWIAEQAERFRDHHVARATTCADWHAAWRTWVRNAEDFAARDGRRLNGAGRPGAAQSGSVTAAMHAILSRGDVG